MIATEFTGLVFVVGGCLAVLQYLELRYPCVRHTKVLDFVVPRIGVAVAIAICQLVLEWPISGGTIVTQVFAFLGVLLSVELLIRILLANLEWMIDTTHWRQYRQMIKRNK